MVVSCPGVEVDQNMSALNRRQETVKAEFPKHHNLVEPEIFNAGNDLGFCLNIEAVMKLASCFMLEVVKPPVRLRRELSKTNVLLDVPKPGCVPFGDFRRIE